MCIDVNMNFDKMSAQKPMNSIQSNEFNSIQSNFLLKIK